MFQLYHNANEFAPTWRTGAKKNAALVLRRARANRSRSWYNLDMDNNEMKLNPIVNSGYTSRARPSRGYHDCFTTVTFAPSEGTEPQRQDFLAARRSELVKHNQWCSAWRPADEAGNAFTITYGYDSGD